MSSITKTKIVIRGAERAAVEKRRDEFDAIMNRVIEKSKERIKDLEKELERYRVHLRGQVLRREEMAEEFWKLIRDTILLN